MKSLARKSILSICSFLAFTLGYTVETTAFQKGGYFENWAQYRNNGGQIKLGTFPACSPTNLTPLASNIDELMYAFALFNYDTQTKTVTNDWAVQFSEWNDVNKWQPAEGQVVKAANLRQQNPKMKLILSIGGWNFNTNDSSSPYGPTTYKFYQQLLANQNGEQSKFIQSLTDATTGILFLKTPDGDYIFDGVDIDYEYPGQTSRGGAATDYEGFITFIKALRSAFDSTSRTLYITMTIPPFLPNGVIAGTWSNGTYPDSTAYGGGSIDPTNPSTYFAWMSIVGNLCDWVNLMTYDMYGAFPPNTTVLYQAPLFNPAGTKTYDPTKLTSDYSIDYAVFMWTKGAKQGSGVSGTNIPANKISLGLPAYGRTYGFNQAQDVKVNPVDYSGNAGLTFDSAGPGTLFLQTPGVIGYFELAPLLPTCGFISALSNPPASACDDQTADQSFSIMNNVKASALQPGASPPNMVSCYDSADDFAGKTTYATEKGLRGVFVWALSEDNLYNNAKDSLYLNGIVNTLNNLQGEQTTFTPNVTAR